MADPPTTPEEAIDQNVLGPKRVTIGGETVEQHSIDDQIKAANYIAAQKAAKKPHFGLRFTKIVPPGAG